MYFNTTKISLEPIPYEMKVPKNITSKITLESMTGVCAKQLSQAGVTAALSMNYQAADGSQHGFGGIY